MGVHRILLLKQWTTKPTLQLLRTVSQLPTKLPFQTTRTYTQHPAPSNSTLYSEVVNSVTESPDSEVVPLLEKYVKEGNTLRHKELRNIIHTLRSKSFYHRALEVSEWRGTKTLNHPVDVDHALHLDLVWNVHGIDAAETFFNEVNDHSQKMYGALLNCYVKTNNVDKALSLFSTMKEKGLVNLVTYNCIMSFYRNTCQVEKIPELLSEMEENGITPDNLSYRLCLKSYGMRSDFASIEELLKVMENLAHISVDCLTYAGVANTYIDGGHNGKAIHYLQKAEDIVHDSPVGYNNLISMYAKLGDLTQVMRLWQKRKVACKAPLDVDYMNIMGSLVKLDQLEEAERLLEEWELSGTPYNFHVPNVLLIGYTQKGLVEKAEKMLESITSKGKAPIPNTWSIICAGHIKCQNMEKALHCMRNALELWPQHQGWQPKPEVISSILNWIGDNGAIEEVDNFLKLLSTVVPMNAEMYQTLLKAHIRHGNDTDAILQRMKMDNIEADEEAVKMVSSR